MAKEGLKTTPRRLEDLQPSQLLINQEKFENLQSRINFSNPSKLPPFPIKRLDGTWFMMDGHIRAFAAILEGLDCIPTLLVEDQLDWEAY